jgi:uncharacterized protein YecE (DUF72 family)
VTAERSVIRIGCAGWALRKEAAEMAPPPGTHLQRYARLFNAVEINSSFYRPHRRATYERWAASVPSGFRFSVKVPKAITHTARLRDCSEALQKFLDEVAGLGSRLGPLLVQLPPKLAFDAAAAPAFFQELRQRFSGEVVCEPRNATWFERQATATLRRFDIARAGADPAPVPAAARPCAFPGGTFYLRLHGAPRVYYSAYEPARIESFAAQLKRAARSGESAWCIFDNTAAGAATTDALHLKRLVDAARA